MASMTAVFAATDKLPAKTLRDRCFPTVVFTTADQTVNNSTTKVPIAGLAVLCEGATLYALDAYIVYTSTTTADIKISPDATFGDVNSTNQAAFSPMSVAATSSNPGNLDSAFQTGINGNFEHGGTGHATDTMAMLSRAWFLCPQPGMFQLTFAQVVAEASNTTVKAGSWMRIKKIGEQ